MEAASAVTRVESPLVFAGAAIVVVVVRPGATVPTTAALAPPPITAAPTRATNLAGGLMAPRLVAGPVRRLGGR